MASPSENQFTAEFKFAETAAEESEFDTLVERIYRKELGLSFDDSQFAHLEHRSLLCMVDGVIAAGLKVFVADTRSDHIIPMEYDGIDVRNVQMQTWPDEHRYGEICRVVTHEDYRDFNALRLLLNQLHHAQREIKCNCYYWLAPRSQRINSHRAIRGLGYKPQTVMKLDIVRGNNPMVQELYLSSLNLHERSEPVAAQAGNLSE